MPHTPVCDREPEVLALAAAGGWPGRADQALRGHVETCATCHDLVVVVSALGELSSDAAAAVPTRLPDARVVWHRAQMQARRDAARRATRPVVLAERAAIAVTLTLSCVWASGAGDAIRQVARDIGWRVLELAAAMSTSAGGSPEAVTLAFPGRPIAIAIGASLGLLAAALALTRLADRSE